MCCVLKYLVTYPNLYILSLYLCGYTVQICIDLFSKSSLYIFSASTLTISALPLVIYLKYDDSNLCPAAVMTIGNGIFPNELVVNDRRTMREPINSLLGNLQFLLRVALILLSPLLILIAQVLIRLKTINQSVQEIRESYS